MDGSDVIYLVYEGLVGNRKGGTALDAMREILRENGEFVAESKDDLRAIALAETDLIEPTDE